MHLRFNELKEIITGAVRMEEENGAIKLYRFTKEQEELYKAFSPDHFYDRTFCTAGIRILFKTDSKNLFLKLETAQAGIRHFFSADVFVDGKPVGYLDNYSSVTLPQNYTTLSLPQGVFEKNFQLGDGAKTVCVYLPWSVKTAIKEMALDDGSFVESVKPSKKLLAFGDSITQGCDALRPSNRYISKLADVLGAEEINKAISGEKFFPELAQLADSFVPDYITVAYGTNDWSNVDERTFQEKCKAFYEALRQNYPETKIFAITPIWRKDMHEERAFGEFEKVEVYIKQVVENMKNATVISGFDFVPHDENFFADLKLHPNDDGFAHYFKNLYDKIKSNI